MQIALLGFLSIGTALYWFLRVKIRYFDKKYALDGSIFVIIVFLYAVLSFDLFQSSYWYGGILAVIIGLAHFVILVMKYYGYDYRYRWIHHHNRAIVNYDVPHTSFQVLTKDNVRISGIHIQSKPESKKAVIVCHGASRTKYTAPIVQTCLVLSTEYNVITFDFRGHMESGGTFFINGTEIDNDLVAVVDYAQQLGYEKIAVFGWSVGGAATIRCAAAGVPISAFIAGSPAVEMPEAGEVRLFRKSIIKWFAASVLLVTRQVRMSIYSQKAISEGSITRETIDNLPNIPMLLVYNDYDYVLKIDGAKFEGYFAKFPSTKTLLKLKGRGHLFDWPNTYLLWKTMMNWLCKTF